MNHPDYVLAQDSLESAIATLNRLGVELGEDATVDNGPGGVMLTIRGDVMKSLVEMHLPTGPLPPVKPVEPERIILNAKLKPGELQHLSRVRSHFLQQCPHLPPEDQDRLTQLYKKEKRLLRDAVAVAAATPHVVPKRTLVFGGDIPGAEQIEPSGQFRICHTLIHLSLPWGTEDQKLREQGVQASRVILVRVENLDDEAFQRLEEPEHWPMQAHDWRKLLVNRHRA